MARKKANPYISRWGSITYRQALEDKQRWTNDLGVCSVLARDDDQMLVETTHQQILLLDRSGSLMRCYNSGQKDEALKQWSKYR